jgi:death-on-curing protein
VRLLTLDDLLHIARRALGSVEVRDIGLLGSAAARPATTVFGNDAYQGLHEKAAALVHSICKNHALVDGNKRIALAALLAMLGLNDERLTMDNDEAHDFILDIASGDLDDVGAIAARIAASTEQATFPPE